MKSIDVIGKTVEEALSKALDQLKVTNDKVEVDIIDEGSKGLFNLIGAKPAKIKVTLKADYKDDAKNFLIKVLKCMNVNAEVVIREEEDTININIVGEKMGSVIGYRGETLDSLQYLVSLVVNKNHEQTYKRVILDAENYRKKREETLKRVAEKTAYKVRKSKRPFKLEPMNPYERRVIHSALQNYADIKTFSEGEEPFRRIVVDIKRN
ncbi:protein jag [Clostridium sp. SHJSY1]|uniref:RNA-binding cell elongation regulator Jag/EloR n=1 Tax=Clostridium sp. SHJSY1 TaxID=2942483 RepID=UPI0028740633|nr:RNA-binding cell elongation regulator Jag/EloR [Clostridium sp. SHJSY1]MDS0527930.1 protein jag [Clostridium sp. SHJSY1]